MRFTSRQASVIDVDGLLALAAWPMLHSERKPAVDNAGSPSPTPGRTLRHVLRYGTAARTLASPSRTAP